MISYLAIPIATWASYQISKIPGCACAGNAGNGFPRRRFQRKLLVSDPGMYHGTCVPHVPWCMPGLPTCGDGENVPDIPVHAHPRFCVSGKRPMAYIHQCLLTTKRSRQSLVWCFRLLPIYHLKHESFIKHYNLTRLELLHWVHNEHRPEESAKNVWYW